MADLPNPNQSRTESYLGVIVGQEGAIEPSRPQSRVEIYLDYLCEHGIPTAGSTITVTVDPATYVMTLEMRNKDGEVISTASVDLPLEEMIISARYDAATKTLILTLKNGQTISIPLADIISGLVVDTPDDEKLYARSHGTWVEIARYTAEEKAKLADLENYDDTEVREAIASLATTVGNKQDTINDLETIRSGAAAGATAVQDSSYVHTDNNYDNTAKAKVEAAIDKTVNDLINYYLKSDTYTKTEVNALIAAIRQFTYVLAPSLPEASASTLFKIYLIPSERAKTDNVKDEFITIDNGEGAADRYTWEQIGSTAVDLSGYYTKAEVDAMFARAITYEVQNLTDAQKVQARRNIGAASIDTFVRNALIGGVTKEQYNDLMKEWFLENGCLVMTDLTQLVQKWYSITRIGWNGGTKFSATTESSVSTGTAIGDNVGLNCTPSTNTVAGTDNYASLPMFAIKDANVTLDEFGDPHVTAIEGIPSANAFARYDTTKVVEVLQMAPWMKYSEDATSYSWEYTDEIGKTGYIPWPSAVSLKDNSVRTWVHHVKYPFGDGYTACSGQKVRVWDVSHNSQLTGVRTAWGNKYCGKTSSDDGWVKHMTMIKYKSLTLDNIMNGCLSYYYNTVHPAIAEEDVERVIVAKSTGNAWLVGSTICVGSSAYGGKSTQCSVVDRAKIVSIEDVEIEGTVYSAVNLDNGGVKFATTTELFVTTMQWYTGSTDNVLGNDGSPYSNTSTKEPYKIQGIEQIVGCYEVMGDTILSYIDGYQVPHVCRDASKLATSITADYKRCSFGYPQPAAGAWTYSKKLGFDSNLPELLYPSESGGSSSTFTRDGYYIDGYESIPSALREWLAFGHLSTGLAYGGLSCLYGDRGLANPSWYFGGRLSSNGNRGEFEPSAA